MRDSRIIKTALVLIFLLALAGNSSFGAYVSDDVPSRITKAIVSYLVTKDKSYANKKIEVSYKYADRIFRELKTRKGKVTFSIAELYPDFKPVGNIIVPIQVIVDDVPKEKIFLRMKVSIFDRIVVATKRLKRGDMITSAEAAVEERDVAVLNPNIIKDINLVIGKESKTYIPSLNPIYDWMIKEKPLVRKNEKVKINAISQNILVVAVGISLEDGDLGSKIKVKNLSSGKALVGMVTGMGEVTVQ
ncbi:MAG: flagellar basal body P-ring formation chaperone FlgA [bacterium]